MHNVKNSYWRDRFERLKIDNQGLKDKLASSKKENNDLQKELRNRDRLFHGIPAGIVLEQQGRMIAVNTELLEELGYAPGEVIGQRLLKFVPQDLKKKIRDLDDKRVSGKKVPSQFEIDLLTKNGERRCYEARVKKIRYDGRRAFVTNLTLLEKRKKEELERVEVKKREALTTMAASLARRLNENISGVSEYIQQIKELVDSEDAALAKRLENAVSSSNEVIHIIRKLEGLLESRRGPSEETVVDLKKAMDEAVSIAIPTLKGIDETPQQGINLKTFYRSAPEVLGDVTEIRGLMVYLILNAIEAMPHGGDLYVTIEEDAGYAHIYIQDSGMGIPAAVQDRVMDPFFTTKGPDRLGLGLSLSHAIIKRHKGEMAFAGEKHQGTTFTVRLPTVSEEHSLRRKAPKKKIKNSHILVIGGEEILCQILLQVFIAKGHRVVTAGSALEGLHIMKKKKFDLILADSGTQDMQRDVVIRKMRKVTGDTPIAIITEQTAEGPSESKKKSEFDLIITKPLDMNRVVSDVEDVLREHVK